MDKKQDNWLNCFSSFKIFLKIAILSTYLNHKWWDERFLTHPSPGIAEKALLGSHARVGLHPQMIFSSYEGCLITNKNQPLLRLKKPHIMTNSHKIGLPGHASFSNYF